MVALCVLGLAVTTSAREARATHGARPEPEGGKASRAAAACALDAIPLYFEEGGGAGARFTARADGYALALEDGGVSIALGRGTGAAPDVVRMRFAGTAAMPAPVGEGVLRGTVNRFAGPDSSAWREGIRTFSRVRYAGVYPGVDAVCYGTRRDMEYDFVVAPGANANAIRLAFDGARALSVSEDGALVVKTGGAEIRQRPPVAYQESAAGRRAVACGYAVRGTEARLELGAYDRRLPLVVDPALTYATYFGGSSIDEIHAVAVDAAGNIYVTGKTTSVDFPVGNRISGPSVGSEIFVSEISASGGEIVYSTTVSGRGQQNCGYGIAVDAGGNAFIAASVDGHDFPVLNAVRPNPPAQSAALLLKLDSSGSLVFSTFLGGGLIDVARGVALDPAGNPVVVGYTLSSDFPSIHAVQPNRASYDNAGASLADAFVMKVSADGREILFATTLGGANNDEGNGVAVDPVGNIYVVGLTVNGDYPTTPGSVQAAPPSCVPTPGVFDCWDAFVTKIDASYAVGYSTYLGGGSVENALAVAADSGGDTYITGWTSSNDFPTKSAVQSHLSSTNGDAFVTKIAPDGGSLVYSTYFGGRYETDGVAIAVDADGRAAIAGPTHWSDLVTVDAFQDFIGTPALGSYSFVLVLGPGGDRAELSSYTGGSVGSGATAVAYGSDGALYVGGATLASDLALVSPLRGYVPDPEGTGSAFLLRIGGGPGVAGTPGPVTSPRVTNVRVRKNAAGRPARVSVSGEGFGPGMRVFVGDAEIPETAMKHDGTTSFDVDVRRASAGPLRHGVKTYVRCTNLDGGQSTTYFTPK